MVPAPAALRRSSTPHLPNQTVLAAAVAPATLGWDRASRRRNTSASGANDDTSHGATADLHHYTTMHLPTARCPDATCSRVPSWHCRRPAPLHNHAHVSVSLQRPKCGLPCRRPPLSMSQGSRDDKDEEPIRGCGSTFPEFSVRGGVYLSGTMV